MTFTEDSVYPSRRGQVFSVNKLKVSRNYISGEFKDIKDRKRSWVLWIAMAGRDTHTYFSKWEFIQWSKNNLKSITSTMATSLANVIIPYIVYCRRWSFEDIIISAQQDPVYLWMLKKDNCMSHLSTLDVKERLPYLDEWAKNNINPINDGIYLYTE